MTEMQRENDLQPATKRDLKSEVRALRADLDVHGTSLKAVKDEIKADIGRLAIEIVRTNDRIDKQGEELRTEMRQLNGMVLTALDTSVARMETLWRESAILPHVVGEHGEKLRDHETRLSRLEDRRPTSPPQP